MRVWDQVSRRSLESSLVSGRWCRVGKSIFKKKKKEKDTTINVERKHTSLQGLFCVFFVFVSNDSTGFCFISHWPDIHPFHNSLEREYLPVFSAVIHRFILVHAHMI